MKIQTAVRMHSAQRARVAAVVLLQCAVRMRLAWIEVAARRAARRCDDDNHAHAATEETSVKDASSAAPVTTEQGAEGNSVAERNVPSIAELRTAMVTNLRKSKEDGKRGGEIEVQGHTEEPVSYLMQQGDKTKMFKSTMCALYLQLRVGDKHFMFGDCYENEDCIAAIMGFTINFDDASSTSVIVHTYLYKPATKRYDDKIIDIAELMKWSAAGEAKSFTVMDCFKGVTKKTCFLMKVKLSYLYVHHSNCLLFSNHTLTVTSKYSANRVHIGRQFEFSEQESQSIG